MCFSLSLGLCFLAFPPATIFPSSRKREHAPCWRRAYCLELAHRSLVSPWIGCPRIRYILLAPVSECNGVKWHTAGTLALQTSLGAGSRTASCRKQTSRTFCSDTGDGRVMPLMVVHTYIPLTWGTSEALVIRIPHLKLWFFVYMPPLRI